MDAALTSLCSLLLSLPEDKRRIKAQPIFSIEKDAPLSQYLRVLPDDAKWDGLAPAVLTWVAEFETTHGYAALVKLMCAAHAAGATDAVRVLAYRVMFSLNSTRWLELLGGIAVSGSSQYYPPVEWFNIHGIPVPEGTPCVIEVKKLPPAPVWQAPAVRQPGCW